MFVKLKNIDQIKCIFSKILQKIKIGRHFMVKFGSGLTHFGTQPAFTCSKLTIEIFTMSFVKNFTKIVLFWCLNCYFRTCFTPCSSVSIVNFEHVIAGWEMFNLIKTLGNFKFVAKLLSQSVIEYDSFL